MFMPLFDQDGAAAGPGAELGFYCVRCGAYLEIDAQYAGQACECPRCSHVVPVPAMNGDGAPASAPAQAPARQPLLSQEELDFLSEPEAPGDSHNPAAARK